MSVVLDAYKQGMQRGLVLGASPQPTSLEDALSQEFATFVTSLVQQKPDQPPHQPNPPKPPTPHQPTLPKPPTPHQRTPSKPPLASPTVVLSLGKHSLSSKTPPSTSKRGRLSHLLQPELGRPSISRPVAKTHARSSSLGSSVTSGLAAMLAQPVKKTPQKQKQKQSWLMNLLPR